MLWGPAARRERIGCGWGCLRSCTDLIFDPQAGGGTEHGACAMFCACGVDELVWVSSRVWNAEGIQCGRRHSVVWVACEPRRDLAVCGLSGRWADWTLRGRLPVRI
ncbi:unnamed protein product [Ostreobium quekettii]|uniref:Uncharacterized protein n=1 Tax=Ostreobium quekettii TaxID=121088 RepID=A0A8S1IWE9_9CHLO|nr:unnamed protein product [Ostreobium quekettii]